MVRKNMHPWIPTNLAYETSKKRSPIKRITSVSDYAALFKKEVERVGRKETFLPRKKGHLCKRQLLYFQGKEVIRVPESRIGDLGDLRAGRT